MTASRSSLSEWAEGLDCEDRNMTTITTPADDLPELNGKPHGDTTAEFLAQFERFELAPVRQEDGCCEVCGPSEAEFFSIYGRNADGEALVVHDADDAEELARVARAILRAFPGKAVCWFDTDTGCLPRPDEVPALSIEELADYISDVIFLAIPNGDDPDSRDDDFESHPLAEIREALLNSIDETVA